MKYIFIITFCFLTIFGFSQNKFRGGLKGGVNFTDMIISKTDNSINASYETRTSFHVGSYVQQTFSKHFSWQVEVLFSNKGAKRIIEDQEVNISLNYLNWPLLIVYRPINLIDIEFGPELGYMVSGEDFLASFDFGFDIGAKVNISNKFNAGLRYYQGIPFKMKNTDTTDGETVPTYQNTVFQVFIGYDLINEIYSKSKKKD